MLSYQHIYHAGNLADVHKHAMLASLLAYLARKDKPLSYIETHAGRGLYRLDAPEAMKTGEAAAGIGRAAALFPADHPYRRILAAVRDRYGRAAYPGSPLVAALSLRSGDRMHLAELHPQEFAALGATMRPFAADVRRDIPGAVYAYNHDWDYVVLVLSRATYYAASAGDTAAALGATVPVDTTRALP